MPNPLGGKPDKLMRDALSLELHEEIPDPELKIKRGRGRPKGPVHMIKKLRLVARALVKAGIAGEIPAIREINDRMDGKIVQQISGPGEGPIELGGPIADTLARISDTDLAHLERIVSPIAAAARVAPRIAGGGRAGAASKKR